MRRLRIVDPSGNVVDLNGNVIQSNVCGVYRNLAYQLVDQQRQPINTSAAVTERFFNYAGPAGTPPPFTTTTSAGFLQDTQFIGRAAFDCLLPGEIEEFNQDFVVTIGTTQYVLTTVVFVQRGRNSNGYFVSVSIDQP